MNATDMTPEEITSIREEFETAAHSGYVSAGIGGTDGYFAPEPKASTVAALHRSVPITPAYFNHGTFFRPTQEMIDAYNSTFYVGTDYRPGHLDLAVRWNNGWKTYQVTGTRHAYYMLRKLAQKDGFSGARLRTVLVQRTPGLATTGYAIENVIAFDESDITGSDRLGKYAALLDRNNSHYDLAKPVN